MGGFYKGATVQVTQAFLKEALLNMVRAEIRGVVAKLVILIFGLKARSMMRA